MGIFYIFAIIPLIVSSLFFCFSKKIDWIKSIIGGTIGFVFAGILHLTVYQTMTYDTEVWSGYVINAKYEPPWTSEHQEPVYEEYTDSKGDTHRRISHYETVYENHGDYAEAVVTYGNGSDEISISKEKFDDLVNKFGGKRSERGSRHNYYSGDRNDYFTVNNTNWIEPITDEKMFENRVKESKTLFSHIEVPKNVKVANYPEFNRFQSNRLINCPLNILQFDRLNTRLGPSKKVNLIMVGCPEDSMYGQYLEASWKGGKKNDLVICYHNDGTKNTWAYVFGWTEQEIVKRNLETIMLKNPLNENLFPLIETEVRENYIIKNWHKFDYISIEPPTWAYITYFIGILMLMAGYWAFILYTEKNNFNSDYRYRYNRRF